MAYFNSMKHLHDQVDLEFDREYKPGEKTVYSGIYRCRACGLEAVVEKSRKAPPTHAPHSAESEVRWRLIVRPKHETD